MHDNAAAAQGLHSVAENIPCCGLHNVFDKFRAVGIKAFPLLGAADTFVGDTFAAELVNADLWLYIGQAPAGRESDKKHTASAGEDQTVQAGRVLIFHGFHNSTVHCPPKFDNFRIGLSPCIYQRRQLIFGQAHFNSAHCFKCADAAAVAQCQFCDFTFLTQVAVDTMLLDRHLKHLAGRSAVDIAALFKDLLSPALVCVPCDHTGLNSGKVCYKELCAISGNEGSADKLGEGVRDIFIQQFHGRKVAASDQRTSFGQIWKMVLR